MNIENKFLTLIISFTTLLNISIAFIIHQFISAQILSNFKEKYSEISNTLSSAFQLHEKQIEDLMLSSALLIEQLIKTEGLPNNNKLKEISKQLNLSHIYITDKNGNFIRSTREEPAKLPNIFIFCNMYKSWFENSLFINPTGFLPGIPAGVSSKFFLHGTKDKKYIIEINVEAGFISNTFQKIFEIDHNINSMEILSPNGTSLGFFTKNNPILYEKNPEKKPNKINSIDNKNYFILNTKINATHNTCCSCVRRKLTLENNQYYYLLSLNISKNSLNQYLNKVTFFIFLISILILIMSILISKIFSRRIAGRVDELIYKLKKNKINERLNIKGDDEIRKIADSFDKIISIHEENQIKLIEIEKINTQNKLSKQIAHDIRSPLTVIKLILTLIKNNIDEKYKNTIMNACKRIDDISIQLLNNQIKSQINTIEHIPSLVDKIIIEKKVTCFNKNIKINLKLKEHALFSIINYTEFSRIVSNIINNSIESIKNYGIINVTLIRKDNFIIIIFSDNGKGIKDIYIPKILRGEESSFEKEGGSGLGLSHAIKYLKTISGTIDINSVYLRGTSVTIKIPITEKPNYYLSEINIKNKTTIIIIDDDKISHEIWDDRLSKIKINVIHFYSISDLKIYFSKNQDYNKKIILCAFQFNYCIENGLDAILLLKIENNSIIVSSYFDDQEILKKLERHNIKIIPKSIISTINIIEE